MHSDVHAGKWRDRIGSLAPRQYICRRALQVPFAHLPPATQFSPKPLHYVLHMQTVTEVFGTT